MPDSPAPKGTAQEASSTSHHTGHGYGDVAAVRDLFWQNIVREMLTGLSVVAESRRYQIMAELATSRGQIRVDGAVITTDPALTPSAGNGDREDAQPAPGSHPDMPLDGRVAILTRGGERIPIADVRPMLACSVPGSQADRALSVDVQCTIFQIVAPSGEVFTLPLHEIRAIHAISEELMDRLREAARKQDRAAGKPGDADDSKPFGFAAFTSLAQSQARPNA